MRPKEDKGTDAMFDIFYNCRTVNGVTEVFPQKMFGIIAIVCLIGFIILAVAPIPNQASDATAKIILVCFLGVLSAPLILFSFVLRYYVDSEKIVCKTMLGIKKELHWNDIKTVRVFLSRTVKLYDSHRAVKIYSPRYFGRGYEYLRSVIRKYCTEAQWK